MKMFALSVLGVLQAIGAPIAASAATAHNVVLVPGAFTDKSSWDKVAHLLREKGFKVTEVDIPLTSLEADVAATRKVLDAQHGRDHPGRPFLGRRRDRRSRRRSQGQGAGLCRGLRARQGGDRPGTLKQGPADRRSESGSSGRQGLPVGRLAAFPHVFVGDVPAAEGAELAKKQKPINSAAFGAAAAVAAWHLKPTYYAISANDLMIPPQAEAFFAERMKATTVTIPSSHASPVSHPAAVAALIEEAAKGR